MPSCNKEEYIYIYKGEMYNYKKGLIFIINNLRNLKQNR